MISLQGLVEASIGFSGGFLEEDDIARRRVEQRAHDRNVVRVLLVLHDQLADLGFGFWVQG